VPICSRALNWSRRPSFSLRSCAISRLARAIAGTIGAGAGVRRLRMVPVGGLRGARARARRATLARNQSSRGANSPSRQGTSALSFANGTGASPVCPADCAVRSGLVARTSGSSAAGRGRAQVEPVGAIFADALSGAGAATAVSHAVPVVRGLTFCRLDAARSCATGLARPECRTGSTSLRTGRALTQPTAMRRRVKQRLPVERDRLAPSRRLDGAAAGGGAVSASGKLAGLRASASCRASRNAGPVAGA